MLADSFLGHVIAGRVVARSFTEALGYAEHFGGGFEWSENRFHTKNDSAFL